TLFGQPPPPRKLIVQVRPLALPNALVMRMLRRIPGDRDMYPDEGMRVPRGAGAIPVRLGTADFAMSAGKTCVLFLRTAELPQSGGESQAPVAEHTAEAVPLEEPDAALLASLRAFCRASADWTRPPELPAEEDTQVKALVADLGSEDFGKREQAEAALNAKGARVRLYVEAAAQDRDAERAFRAKVVLQTIQPVPGNFRPPGRGGGNKS
ncbi:MAG TPA: hypothetical protein PK280_01780, partial [Planctomycetota bacterium]|nr:hypothetical protein [Planctomycetota bacterium]